MYRFSGFDGLRGWLAWMVVVHHLVYFTGLRERFSPLKFLLGWGDSAVLIFIVLSGFVITHLLVVKQEPYRFYIARRALRIYPIYFVALLFGMLTTLLTYKTFISADGLAASGQIAFIYPQVNELIRDLRGLDGVAFFEHLGLHLVMLHGAVPNNVLMDSQFMFLGPAWSLSLEWQFYLIAPFVVFAARCRWWSIALAVFACAIYQLDRHQVFGLFVLPSALPAAILYFAVGIGSRLIVGKETAGGSWIAAAIIAAYYIHLGAPLWPIAIWAAFLTASVYEPAGHVAGRRFKSIFRSLFDSRLAKHLGEPSYSTYLLHVPFMHLAMFLCVRIFNLAPLPANIFTIVGTVVGVYFLSQITYRFIEVPGISLGKSFASRVARYQRQENVAS